MENDNKKAHIELDNLAIPEVRFGGEVLDNDAERDDMHVYADNLAIPEVRVGRVAREKNEEAKAVNALNKASETVEKIVSSGKEMRVTSDNLAIPEVRFEAKDGEAKLATAEGQAPEKKKMKIDYSGAVPQITYE